MPLTQNISTARTFKITRLRTLPSSRSLWWWSRQSRSWFGDNDDTERLDRHQAIMLHRYSKALKRRALWDRDNSPRYPWRSRHYNPKLERELSSTRPGRANVEDQEKKQPWQEMHDNFESFKKAVDRAIERDPHGTLFGRRLQSPDTGAGWTSWSWIFDPKEIKEETQETEREKKDVKEETIAGSGSKQTANSEEKTFVFSSGSKSTAEYVYDPISGRKIPRDNIQTESKQTQAANEMKSGNVEAESDFAAQAQPETRSLFDQMFGENGVKIPIKTFKPTETVKHEVTKVEILSDPVRRSRLHDAVRARKTVTVQPAQTKENSRTREYDELRWRTIGNNIDATNFNCEPWNNKFTEEPAKAKEKAPAEDDAPLFSGTTYAARSAELTPNPTASTVKPAETKPSFKSWLEREGFRDRQGMTMPAMKAETVSKPIESAKKIQSALDRSTSAAEIPVKKFGAKLQPSVDRVITSAPTEVKSKATTPKPSVVKSIAEDKREDIDLLRASDVRAAARASRITKQEIEHRKRQERLDMEKDFDARGMINQKSIPSKPGNIAAAISGNMDHVWKHIEAHPDGIVARTIQSLGVKPESPSVKPANVSPASIQSTAKEDQKLQNLAKDLNAIHKESNPSQMQVSKPKPSFLEPTVKPGVTWNVAIEKHTKEFEPKLALMVDQAKQVTKSIREVERQVTAIREARTARDVQIVGRPTACANTNAGLLRQAEQNTSEKQPAKPDGMKWCRTPVNEANVARSQSEFVRIRYNTCEDINRVVLINAKEESQLVGEKYTSIGDAFKVLARREEYIQPIMTLSAQGYTFVAGTVDELLFEAPASKIQALCKSNSEDDTTKQTKKSEVSSGKSPEQRINDLARAEAAAQPSAQIMPPVQPAAKPTKLSAEPSSPDPSHMQKMREEMEKLKQDLAQTVEKMTVQSRVLESEQQHRDQIREKRRLANQRNASQIQEQHSHSISETQVPFSAQSTPQLNTAPLQQLQPTTGTPAAEQIREATRSPSVSRQEQVFSGNRLPPHTTGLPDPEHFQKQNPVAGQYQAGKEGFFARFARVVRKIVLTTVALGAGAYGLGVVSEGMQSRTQVKDGVEGPMRRLVMEKK